MIKKLMPYILLSPVIILMAILLTGLINALAQSLGYIPGLGLYELSLDYYKEILINPDFHASLFLSLYISAVSSVLSIVIGIAVCAALVYSGKSRSIFAYIIRVPILIPHTVAALFAVLILSQSGVLSRLAFAAGIVNGIAEFPNIIYNRANFGVILAYIWKQAPFTAFFIVSSMEGVNRTLEEAALNLGATPVKAFFSITLPLFMPAVINALFIILTFSFGAYELPYLLGITVPKALPVQAYIEYTHPDLRHRPYAMAMNGIIIIITLIIAVFYFLLMYNKLGGLKNDKEIKSI